MEKFDYNAGMVRKTVLLILFILLVCIFTNDVYAQDETPQQLVDAVNALRAQQGLEPYQVDPALMAYAQEHSDYQAAIKTSTHIHSDGITPQDIGLQENVASGTVGFMTISSVINEGWVDYGHRIILVGYITGQIGAGVAFSDDGFVYYTVDIRPGERVESETPVVEQIVETQVPISINETAIPNPDGSIVHTVVEGDTLWSIATAYGVSINDILNLNGIADENAIINIGQKLTIRAAQVTATPPAPEVTETAILNSELGQTVYPTAKPAAVESANPTVTATLPFGIPEPESKGPKITGWLVIYSATFFIILFQAIVNLIKTNRR